MRSIPNYPTDTDALEPVATVTHGGQSRDINSLSLTREIPSSFHAQVLGVGGITEATGNVEWAQQSDVSDSEPTAFNRVRSWPPRVRDNVNVDTGYKGRTTRQLTGKIASVSGEPSSPTSSGLVDGIARLGRKITLPPLLTRMPPRQEDGNWRGVSLYPTFFTDRAARAGSFYSTPPMFEGCVFSAPLMGSMWPERGELESSVRYSDNSLYSAVWSESPWGIGAADVYARYLPSGNSALTRPMELTLMVPPTSSGIASLDAYWGSSRIRLRISEATARADITSGGSVVSVASLSRDGSSVYSLRVVRNGSTLNCTVRSASGNEASGSTATPAGVTGQMTEARVASEAPGAQLGGAQITFPNSAWMSVNYTRNAFITPAAYSQSLEASPAIINRSARDLLEEQAKAELAAMWIDGDGNLRWVNRNRLTGASPALTLTSQDNLKALPWEEDFSAVASVVEVTSRRPTVQRARVDILHLWNASQSGVDPGDEFEWLIHPGSDEDWVMPDLSVEVLGSGTATTNGEMFTRFNRGQNSWIALYAEDSDALSNTWLTAVASASFIDHRSYRVSALVPSQHDPGWTMSLKIPTETVVGSVAGPMRYQPSLGTPVIRGRGKIMWEDVTFTADAREWDAPVLTHDVGWWVQDAAAVQVIANTLAAQTTAPQPVLRGVPIVPDPRLEIGDVVTLSDPDVTGIELQCLVVSLNDDFSAGPTVWSQTCGFRVIDYSITSVTLGDVDLAWAGELLTALDAARAGETLAQFDAAPLNGAPQ